MRRIGCVGIVAAFLLTPIIAKSADLQDAFRAAFGQAAPMLRHTNLQNWGETDLLLKPVLLVHVGKGSFALIVSESFNGAHAAAGDVAVAYLDRDSHGYQPVRVWYEFIESGSFGKPFPRNNVWSFNFGNDPFFVGEDEYCGMGACTRSYDLIGFGPGGPIDWGGIAASGVLTPGFYTIPDGNGLFGCGGYTFSSHISAPRDRGDIMRVTYIGWTVAGGSGQKRRHFDVSTEAFLTQGKVKLRPEVQLPNCGS